MKKWCELIRENVDELAIILTTEMGKPVNEAKGEILFGANFLEWFSEEAKRNYGEVSYENIMLIYTQKRFSTDQSRYKIVVVPVTSFVPVLNEWLQIPTTPDNFFSLSDNSKSYQHKRNRYNSNASWSCWNDYTLEFSKRNDSKKGLSCLKTT